MQQTAPVNTLRHELDTGVTRFILYNLALKTNTICIYPPYCLLSVSTFSTNNSYIDKCNAIIMVNAGKDSRSRHLQYITHEGQWYYPTEVCHHTTSTAQIYFKLHSPKPSNEGVSQLSSSTVVFISKTTNPYNPNFDQQHFQRSAYTSEATKALFEMTKLYTNVALKHPPIHGTTLWCEVGLKATNLSHRSECRDSPSRGGQPHHTRRNNSKTKFHQNSSILLKDAPAKTIKIRVRPAHQGILQEYN